MSEPLIDIRPDQWTIVADILRRHVPDREVWAFGSRATWNAKEYSDLDLAVIGDTPLSLSVSAALADDLAESDLPFKVDVVDWATTSESFRKIIERDKVVVQAGSKSLGMGVEQLVGTVPDGWEYTTLGAACERGGGDIQTGPFGSQLHASDYLPAGIPSIMPQNIGDNRIIEDGIARIAPGDAARLSRYLVRKGDIVYSRRGDVERRALVREREDGWLCGTGCLCVRLGLGEKSVDPRYASFYLGHPNVREWVVRHAHGATMQNLNTSILAACPFVVPPKNEQRAIAHILGTLDDKIELNRRMNETLEAMARALFKSWFIDFNPVRAKMNLPSPPGRGAGGEGTQPSLRTNAPIPTELLDFARQLRRQATDAETLLWRLLRGRQLANAKFRRQYAFPPYILDFYCHELKLAVELDGGQHNEDAGRRRDARRDEYLAVQGIRVLRFWNNDVLRETEAMLEAIYAAVVEHSNGVPSPPTPLPEGEGSFGIPKPLADLFPARLVDSELGEIPEGWKVGSVLAQAALLSGGTPKTDREDYWNGSTLWASAKDVSQSGEAFLVATERTITEKGLSESSTQAIPAFSTVVVARGATTGRMVMFGRSMAMNQTCYALASKTETPFALYCHLRHRIDNLVLAAHGSVFDTITTNTFSASRFLLPPVNVLACFERNVSPLFGRILANTQESRTLAALRDSLLPKLISGDLRVKVVKDFEAA